MWKVLGEQLRDSENICTNIFNSYLEIIESFTELGSNCILNNTSNEKDSNSLINKLKNLDNNLKSIEKLASSTLIRYSKIKNEYEGRLFELNEMIKRHKAETEGLLQMFQATGSSNKYNTRLTSRRKRAQLKKDIDYLSSHFRSELQLELTINIIEDEEIPLIVGNIKQSILKIKQLSNRIKEFCKKIENSKQKTDENADVQEATRKPLIKPVGNENFTEDKSFLEEENPNDSDFSIGDHLAKKNKKGCGCKLRCNTRLCSCRKGKKACKNCKCDPHICQNRVDDVSSSTNC